MSIYLVLNFKEHMFQRMCLSKNLIEAFFKHSIIVRIPNLFRLVPQNRDGTSLSTPRLDE